MDDKTLRKIKTIGFKSLQAIEDILDDEESSRTMKLEAAKLGVKLADLLPTAVNPKTLADFTKITDAELNRFLSEQGVDQ